jgi:hypothetical protein
MQHSTHNHTPTRTTTTTPTKEALDGPGREQPENNTPRVSPQDPTVCQALRRSEENRALFLFSMNWYLCSTQPHTVPAGPQRDQPVSVRIV